MQHKKVRLGLVALVTLIASVTLTFGVLSNRIKPGLAQPGLGSRTGNISTTDFYIPGSSNPWGTTFDSNGNVWLAIPGCDPSPTCNSSTPPGRIAAYSPAKSSWIANYQLPSGYAQPLFLAFDAQGQLWFPMPMSNSLGMFDPATQTFSQWSIPTPGAGPWDVTIDKHGNVWFTEHYTNQIGYFNPNSGTFTEIATPATNSLPYGITVDASNNVWFTENNSSVALIGEYTPAGRLLEYKIRNGSTSGLTPHLITVDLNGNIWWSEGWVGKIGELNVSLASPGTNNGVTEYGYLKVCNTCGSHTSGIGVDGSGQIWFDDSLQSIFGSFPDNGSGAFTTYNTPTSNSHPHDGLNIDSQNRIWFDEEFANKLARAVQNGIATSTPTPTPGISPVASPSPTSTPTPTATATVTGTLGQDTFQRANQKLWGTASDGQIWGGDANSASAFSIVGNTGHIANGTTSYSAVLGASATNAEVLFSGSLSSFNNTNLGAVLRWTDGNNWYKAYIDGTNLVLQKKVNGSTTILSTTPFAATGGTSYTLRFRVVGTTLSTKVWPTSGTEPANWMVTATDTSFSSGYCGLRMLVQGSATATITSFKAVSL